MLTNQQKRWNVIFLVDGNPANRVVMLKRAPEKGYAPNFYTGIGGKIGDLPGLENESPLESAYRELAEETVGDLGKQNIELHEFARCVYESGLELYYFYGQHSGEVPDIDPKDGELAWVSTDDLLDKEIIPTTQAVCREWSRRGYRTDQPFTVRVREVGMDRTVRLIETLEVLEGLTPK